MAVPQLLGNEHTVVAYVEIPEGGAEGVLACTGGEFGGWSLFVKNGKLHYAHNYLKTEEFLASSESEIPTGEHTLGFRYTPTKKNLKPDYFLGNVELIVDGKPVGRLNNITSAGQYSAVTGYGLRFSRNTGTPVSHEYKPPFEFTGQLDKVTIQVGESAVQPTLRDDSERK